MAAVTLTRLTRRFGNTTVIRDIDLQIADGEFVVFVGASGCGKSTLLRLIAGLEVPTSGQISIGSRDVTALPPARRGVSMVFQSYALYPHMDVYRNIAFGLQLEGVDRAGIQARVQHVAQMLLIADLLGRRPEQLSGGQRQRVAIARAIVREPQVFLFDEPLSNLDAALRAQTRLELAALHLRLGTTMIYVTHDQLEAMTLADRVVLLNAGGIEQQGSPAELYHHPATRFAARFMGSPAMNLLPVQVMAQVARLPDGSGIPLPGVHYQGPAELGVRPENISLAPSPSPATCILPGLATMIEELGEARIVHVTLQSGPQVAMRQPADRPAPARGEALQLCLDPRRLHLFGPDGLRILSSPTS